MEKLSKPIAKYEFGAYCLDAGSRLLTREAEPVALPPKTFDLLLLLLENQGKAVSRDQLITILWPGEFVEEANLTFQISTLRKALGQPAAAWLETVPKYGYRFTPPASTPTAAVPAKDVSVKRALGNWWLLGLAILVAGLIGVLVAARNSVKVGTQPIAEPLTAYVGMEFQPSLSPDGSQVAFSWNGPNQDNFDIYVKLVGRGEPLRLTSDPENDFSPAWSPDGRWIAFLRSALNGVVTVHVIPALGGGAEEKIVEMRLPTVIYVNREMIPNGHLDWTPDSKWLCLVGVEPGNNTRTTSIWLVSHKTRELRRLTTPPDNVTGDFGTAVSPDGRMLAFIRLRSGASNELMLLPLRNYDPAGPPKLLTQSHSAMESPSWTPDSRAIVYSSGPTFGVRHLYRLPVNDPVRHPELLAVGEDATKTSIARTGRIAYARASRDSNIWALDLSRPGTPPKMISASTRDDYGPDYSPDGKKIVFASSRSGTGEIWIANSDGSSPMQLTHIGGPHASNPRWSPDGKAILFDSRENALPMLYLLDPSTGETRKLTKDQTDENEGRWSRDGRWVYYNGRRGRHGQLWKASRDNGQVVPVTTVGGSNGQESADGKYIYFTRGLSTGFAVWRRSMEQGTEQLLFEGVNISSNFYVAEKGIYYLANEGKVPFVVIRFFDFATRKTTELLTTGKRAFYGLTVSPDRHELLYAVVDSWGSDLMFADGVR